MVVQAGRRVYPLDAGNAVTPIYVQHCTRIGCTSTWDSQGGAAVIDIETPVYNRVATKMAELYPYVFMSSEYIAAPSRLPAVSLGVNTSAEDIEGIDSSLEENFNDITFEMNVYSNAEFGKKDEAKALAQAVDTEMRNMGFYRSILNPVPNMSDSTIYRILGRYRAKAGSDGNIYRR
jgi:hypothetical protein